MKKLFFLFFSFLLLQSCLDESDTVKYEYESLIIDEAITPDSFTFGETYDLTVKYSLPNSCYSFYALYYEQQDTTRVVAVTARVNLEASCTEIITQHEYTFPVTVGQQEDYVFKFWKGKDAEENDVFEEVVIPVN